MSEATDNPDGRRHSVPEDATPEQDPLRRAEIEAQNGLRQFDAGMHIVEEALSRGNQFRLRPSTVLTLHREALRDLTSLAGNWRPAGVRIEGSRHAPVEAHLVPELMEELCDYVNERWQSATPLHLAAYVMWRLNWIHPFTDGNGRTSRIVSYVVMCIALGSVLRGKNTIPEQIVDNRKPYFNALEAADDAFADNCKVDVSDMEDLLEGMLAVQLKGLIEAATHKTY
jgi:Fic family protein